MSDNMEKEAQQAASVDTELNGEAAAEVIAEEQFDLQDYLQQYQELQAAHAAAQDAVKDAEDKLLRLQADFDNYRRRQRQESEETSKRAEAALMGTLLPVLDNFDRALDAMGDSPDKQGVEMISKQLIQVLQNAGLTEMQAAGEMFDPNLHQAVLQVEVDEADKGKVTMVLQKGYLVNGKLLRAAMVQVGM